MDNMITTNQGAAETLCEVPNFLIIHCTLSKTQMRRVCAPRRFRLPIGHLARKLRVAQVQYDIQYLL